MNKKFLLLILLCTVIPQTINAASNSRSLDRFIANTLYQMSQTTKFTLEGIVYETLITTTYISAAYGAYCFAESLMLPHDEKNNQRKEELVKRFRYSMGIAAGSLVAIIPSVLAIQKIKRCMGYA